MGSLVLFSGGMDSTVALFSELVDVRDRLQGKGEVHALSFLYGQRHVSEVKASETIWRIAAKYWPYLGQHIVVELSGFPLSGSLMEDRPVQKYDGVPTAQQSTDDDAYIPGRNIIFLSVAAAWAVKLGADRIVTGLRGGWPDCTEQFTSAMTKALRIGLGFPDDLRGGISVVGKLHRLSRKESVELAQTIHGCLEAISYSLTCFEGVEPPCGKCLPCQKRQQGFELAGIKDPLLVRYSG